jgi:outer membrane protein assembly factor BamB
MFPEQQSGGIVTSDGTIVIAGKHLEPPDMITTYLKAFTDEGDHASLKWESEHFSAEHIPWSQLAEGPDGSIYAAIGYPTYQWGPDTLYRFDPNTGDVIDQSSEMTGLECRSGLAIGYDGLIYAGAHDYVYCFNADCSLKWSYAGTYFTDAALDVDGSLFVADVIGGYLYRFQTE